MNAAMTLARFAKRLLFLLVLGVALPAARAETHAVQPGDRFAGHWVADSGSLTEYLNAILFPVAAQCDQIEGSLLYSFHPTSEPGNYSNLIIERDGLVIHMVKSRSDGQRRDKIDFALHIRYQAAYKIHAGDQLLEFGADSARNIPEPAQSRVWIENLIVNDVEVMEGSGEISMLGLDLSFVTAQMRFEFKGDDRLELTPIFPPAPDGVSIDPRPLVLRRR